MMRKTLRKALVAGGLSLVALGPLGTAVASATQPAGGGTPAATVLRDQHRLQLRDGSCQLTAAQLRDQDRLRLRDGSCNGTRPAGAVHRANGPGFGAQHRSGALDGTRTQVRPMDGTGLQWHGQR